MLTECAGGWHGLNCTERCVGHCLYNAFRNHVTDQCDRECAYGWYGQYCNETCIGHCIKNGTCNQRTGLCDADCAAGWRGYKCDEGWIITKQHETRIIIWIQLTYKYVSTYLTF